MQVLEPKDIGLINLDGQYNCFVNVVIQALWTSDIFRKTLLYVMDMVLNPKFKEYRFMTELQGLLKSAFSTTSSSTKRDLSLNPLRAELYKLYYLDQLFDLNVKGDSAEFLTVLLKLIHACFIDSNLRLNAG
jgi:uncharacterized UBP type Zn finger protein